VLESGATDIESGAKRRKGRSGGENGGGGDKGGVLLNDKNGNGE